MAEPKRIHPVDAEAPAAPPRPSAPLLPRDSLRSDKGDPPPQRTIPVQYLPPPRRRRSCCLRCCCWSLCLLLALLVALAVAAGVLYLVFQPKTPGYSVDKLAITAFQVDSANSNVAASFTVTVTAANPNKAIGIYYVDGSRLTASYRGYQLCEGELPVFYQGHRNTTVFDVLLTGGIVLNAETVAALEQAQAAGSVPLVFRGRVPVRVKLGALNLWKVKFYVTCDLVASGLAVGSPVSIRSSRCRFKFRM